MWHGNILNLTIQFYFSIAYEWAFDDYSREKLKCEVHSFDPTWVIGYRIAKQIINQEKNKTKQNNQTNKKPQPNKQQTKTKRTKY